MMIRSRAAFHALLLPAATGLALWGATAAAQAHTAMVAAAAVAPQAAAAAAPGVSVESRRFRRWLDAEWEATLKRAPVLATRLGDPRYNAAWVNTQTPAFRAQHARQLRAQLAALKGFKRGQLDAKDRVSFDILARDLQAELDGQRFPSWMLAINQFGGLPGFLAQMGSGRSVQPFRNTRDYDDWLKRLALASREFRDIERNLAAGAKAGVTQPKAVMEKVVPQLAALAVEDPKASLFWGVIEKFPETVPAADRRRIETQLHALLRTEVLPAYRHLHAFVRDQYLPRCRNTFAWSALPDGAAWYSWQVAESTTTALSVERIHEIGHQEVQRILGEMNAVRQQVGFNGDLQAFFADLRDNPRHYFDKPEDLLAGYRALQQRINGLLPKLFDIAPKADYEVREVPAFLAQSAAGASYESPSVDGSRPGVFYVNTFNLKAQPKFGMETLSLHEASPGHHFQIAIAQEDPDLPKFRRFGSDYTAYVEGWALYAESIGKELGLFTDPYQWYGRLADEQLRAMRLVVDTGLHAKGWSRDQAIEFMLTNSSMARTDVEAEVDRYMVWPGQALGYKIGQLEISRLRREAEAALGAKFDVKGFHRVVLTAGSVPLSVLRAQVDEWVASRR